MATVANTKNLYLTVFVLGAMAVVFGAFGAHYLANELAPKQLASFKTGVLYHFTHVIAATLMLILADLKKSKDFIWGARLLIIGIILFSGSLYLLSTRELLGISVYKWLGPLTPIGGVFFIVGWVRSAIYFVNEKDIH